MRNLKDRLVLILLLALSACRGAPVETTPTPIPTAIVPLKPTYTVQSGEVVKTLEFSGRVAPVVQQELFFSMGGRVAAVNVQRNSRVTGGQVLAALESSHSEYEVRRAQVNLEIAQLNLEFARSQPPSAQQAYDVAVSERQVELAQLTVDELVASVARTQLVAPFDGQLLSLNLAEGRTVEAFQPVALVADVSQMEVSADLLDQDLRLLSEGLPVTTRLASLPGQEFTGAIRRLPYPYGSGPSLNSRDESTRVSLDAPAGAYALGDLVRVTVILEHKQDVLWLPPQAIRTFDGRTFVVVQEGQVQRRADVELGIRAADRVEVVGGLAAGQVVVGP